MPVVPQTHCTLLKGVGRLLLGHPGATSFPRDEHAQFPEPLYKAVLTPHLTWWLSPELTAVYQYLPEGHKADAVLQMWSSQCQVKGENHLCLLPFVLL